MSELRAHNINDLSLHDITTCDFYLKSEADKVIAGLKEGAKNLILDNYLKDQELKHHKYKRCLAMARWCRNQREIYEIDSYNWELERDAVASLRDKANIMRKWHRRWLELAKIFKEAK